MEADFPFARSLIVLRSERTIKKTNNTTSDSRYYLSSASPGDYTPHQWLGLIRGHWGGVEIRNHWRRDALMGEDRSRSRHPHLLANLALIRNALLARLADKAPNQPLPILIEMFAANPNSSLTLLLS